MKLDFKLNDFDILGKAYSPIAMFDDSTPIDTYTIVDIGNMVRVTQDIKPGDIVVLYKGTNFQEVGGGYIIFRRSDIAMKARPKEDSE